MRDLRVFQSKRDLINGIESLQIEEDNPLNTSDFKLTLLDGNRYSNKEVLSTRNLLVITEFLQFITVKIDNKIQELTREIEKVDFL